MSPLKFIEHWRPTGASERSNYQLFLSELCDVLGVGHPDPAGADTRAVIDRLAERYPSVELLARRERERSAETRQELVADIHERLTGRQRLALQNAYLGGFFDWPRETSGEELAASMDISPSTYHQHLRTAERKVLAALFED